MCSPLAARAAVDAPSARVIRQSGAALGVSHLASVHVIQSDGSVSAIGLHGTGRQYAGISSHRFAEFTTLSPFEQDDGFDGRVAWNRDRSGMVWNDGSDAGRSLAVNSAFVNTYALWQKDAGGASVRSMGARAEKGRSYDVLRVTPPQSKLSMDVWFDSATHLPSRVVQAKGDVVSTTLLSGYRRMNGLMIPYAVHVESSDGNNSDSVVSRVTIDPPGGEAHLARPVSSVHDFSMLAKTGATTVPIALVENHVYLDVMLNGKGPYRFIFDTGGENVVDPAVAREIGAVGNGSAQGSGVGSQTQEFSFANVSELRVGDALLKDQLFAVAPVRAGFGVSAGQPADGLIGWEVLARYITTFDYARGAVVLRMPNGRTQNTGEHVLPFVFNGTQPQVACGIDGIASQCTIDTGARDTLTFYTPYLAAHPSVVPATLTAPGVSGFGFGGAAMGRLGRVRAVTLDGITLNDLVADYSTQTAGAFASPFTAANIGGNLLRRFDVTFDYYQQTMELTPNGAFQERDSYDRGGMFLIRQDGKPVVVDSRPGTPAAEAGIAKGDVLASIDGAPTASMSLERVRAYFLQAAGTTVNVGVIGKDGTQRVVTVTLRDYV